MFNFSSKTLVNREYKVSDFLKQIKASKEVKEDAKKIDKIFFQNVINANSINVEEDIKYQNIYVIKLVLKTSMLPRLFIEELDKNIGFHTYFVCEFETHICTTLAYKEIGNAVKIGTKYYGHAFAIDEPVELPRINSVADAYKAILAYEIGIKAKESESPEEYVSRVKAINKLEFQISKTDKAIQYETQPKKKFEYNERLRKYKKELNLLYKEE